MDELRPDKDEVDRFRSQRFGKKSQESADKKPAPARNAAASTPPAQPAARDPQHDEGAVITASQRLPAGDETRISAPPPRRAPPPSRKVPGKPDAAQAQVRSGSGWSTVLLFLCLVAVSSFLGFQVWQQSKTIEGMEESLGYATEYMKQSKLLMARLDGRVTESSTELQTTGSETGEKIAFLDSEVRKLWGVSYDRNRKAIEGNTATIESTQKAAQELETRMKSVSQSVGALETAAKSAQKSQVETASKVATIEKEVGGVRASNSKIEATLNSLSAQNKQWEATLNSVREELATLQRMAGNLDQFKQDLGQLQSGVKQVESKVVSANQAQVKLADKELSELNARLKSLEGAIQSIDSFRRTANERTIRLERRVNEMQLQMQAQTLPTP